MTQENVDDGGASGISKIRNQWSLRFQIGRRSGLLLSLLIVGWVIRGGNQLTQLSALCLVIAWAVVYLVNLFVDTRISSEMARDDDMLCLDKN